MSTWESDAVAHRGQAATTPPTRLPELPVELPELAVELAVELPVELAGGGGGGSIPCLLGARGGRTPTRALPQRACWAAPVCAWIWASFLAAASSRSRCLCSLRCRAACA